MTTKRRDPEKSRSKLLDAATVLFAEHGFDRTTLAMVGKRAGVSRGLPAYMFTDKETLYRAVLARVTGDVRKLVLETVQSQAAAAGIEDVLESLVTAYTGFLAANQAAVRLLQWESLNPPRTRQAGPEILFGEALVVVEKALKRSGYSFVNGRLLLLNVVGMCFFPFGFARGAQHDQAFVDVYKKQVLQLTLHGIGGLS